MKPILNLCFSFIVCLFTFYVTTQNAYATHIVGSEITYNCTSTPGIFEVSLVLYRKCDGAPLCPENCGAACSQTLELYGADASCSSLLFNTITLSLVGVRDININNTCPGAKNACTNMGCVVAGSYTPAIERYEFKGFANIGPTSGIPQGCCNVRIAYSLCCRSIDISTGSANANFYVDAVINRCLSVVPCNNSPQLSNDPVMIICGGESAVLNTGAIDPDMDSLSYSFAPAMAGFGNPVPYTPPFAYDKPMPWTGNANGPFPAGIHCDPQNGDIYFTPQNSGTLFTGVVAIEIKQWKKVNGVMTVMGITHRDFEMMVRGDCLPNNPPRLVTDPGGASNNNIPQTKWEICAGEKFCFTITAKDTDFYLPLVSDTTYLTWNAGLASLGATFKPDYDPLKRRLPDTSGGGPREDRFIFCWTPTNTMANTTPYFFTVQGKDSRCPNPGITTMAFSIHVLPKPSVTIHRNIDTCGRLLVSFTNNTPALNIGSYVWDISPANDPEQHAYYENQNPAAHSIKDTGLYMIRLALKPGPSGSFACSDVASDSIRTTRTSLVDTLVVTQPTCFNILNGAINITATNGVQPYLYSLNKGGYSANHLFTSLPVGTYSVHVKDASGCIIERQVELKAHKLIQNEITGKKQAQPGDTLLYGFDNPDHLNATWSVTNGTILSGQHSEYVEVLWNTKGIATVSLIVSDSNCSDTATINVTIGNTGLTDVPNKMGVKVYPNPTQSILNIQASAVVPDTRIQVYNILGKLLLEQELTTHQQLNLESFAAGLYFIKIGDWKTSVVKE
jgi:hypothetical protein